MSQSALDALKDDFEIRRTLGTGSMATVHLAWERALGREVAIKVLNPRQAADETARKRFEREARAAASLVHENVVQVYRFGRLPDDTPYLVMRYVKGRTMEERLAAEGPMRAELVVPVLRDVASALSAAHQQGILHRDVRPANVLWDEEQEKALLADFGIAALLTPTGDDATRLTRTGQMIGDPKYLSPEQLLDQDLTSLADIYSFGILGYELLTGEGPYDARSNTEWITAHLQGEPTPLVGRVPNLSPNVAALLGRCLNREPNHRPAAADIVRGLDGDWQVRDVADSDIKTLIEKKVPQLVGVGAIVASAVVGAAATLSEQYDWWPSWGFTVSLFSGAGIVVSSAILAWYHGERGRQKAPLLEYALLTLVWIVVIAASATLALASG